MPGGPSLPRPDPFAPPGSGEMVTETAEDPLLAGPATSSRVLLAGGSGFLARHLIPRLLQRGHRVRAVCRHGGAYDHGAHAGLEWVAADLAEPTAVTGIAEGCEVVVHLAGGRVDAPDALRRLDVETTRHLVREAGRAGSRRLVYVSALGVEEGSGALFAAKREGEAIVRSGRSEHVVIRPSMVVGPDDHVVSVLARVLRRGPLLVPHDGGGVVQPAAVEDVAEALCQTVERADLADTAHDLAGPDALGPTDVIRAVASRLSLTRRLIRLPRWSGRRVERLADRTGLTAPLALGALAARALPEARASGPRTFRTVFLLEPLPFEVALEDYL